MSIVLISTALHLMNSIQADTVNVAVCLPLQVSFYGKFAVGRYIAVKFRDVADLWLCLHFFE